MDSLDGSRPVRLLVVEDDPDVRAITVRALEKAGYEVFAEETAGGGLQAARQKRPDLVLLDRDLPDGNGMDVCRHIKNDEALAETLVVIVSATYVQSEQQAEGLESGADGYITRPIANREFLARVASFVRIQRMTVALIGQTRQLQASNEVLSRQQLASLNLMEDAIAARRRVEAAYQELRASEGRVRRLLEESPDAILLLARDGHFVEANPAAQQLYGYSNDEFMRMNLTDLSQEQLESEFLDWSAAERTDERQYESRHRTCAGESIRVEVRAAPFVLEGKQAMLLSIRDLTERRQAEEKRALAQAQAVQSQRLESIGTLASGVAHEINNPLNVVMNYAQLIAEDSTASSAVIEHANVIIKESERMAAIVRNLLAFTRLSGESARPEDVGTLVETTLSLIRMSLIKDSIHVLLDIDPGRPRVLCKAQQIRQVFVNLIVNARDALNERFPSRDANKRIVIACSTTSRNGRDYARVTVTDTGCGIPEAVGSRVFDEFFTTKDEGHGTGLGLSISRSIVEAHEGQIWFDSKPGEGTNFHVELPLAGSSELL